jgi:2-(1,2-epoxy-1,2-dihydrophenyl)acetyl-CoA isomerase
MGEFETIRYRTTDDGLAEVTLARPEKRNAMDARMFEELAEAAALAAGDESVRCVVVSSDGPSFCAGIDLTLLGQLAGTVGGGFDTFIEAAQRPFRLLATMGKPTIAAVQGHALGAGFQLALACDLRVAAEDATFAVLEGRFGIIPDLAGLHHLARIAGAAVAKELVWTARSIGTPEAHSLRLVNRVVPTAELAPAAHALAEEVLAYSPVSTALTKSLVNRAAETSLEQEFEQERKAQATALASEDHREAVAAYLAKRPPRFKGR